MLRRRRFAAATFAVTAVTLAGCSGRSAPTGEGPADAAYTVRAEIVRLPRTPGGELYLRHESVPAFRDSRGETVGMASMTMPFGAPAELDLSGHEPGDRVTVAFEVRWNATRMPLRVTRLEPLPDGTRLEFDPGGGDPAESPSAADGAASTQPEGETPR